MKNRAVYNAELGKMLVIDDTGTHLLECNEAEYKPNSAVPGVRLGGLYHVPAKPKRRVVPIFSNAQQEEEKEEFLLPTFSALVTVKTDDSYDLYLLTENFSKWAQDEPERSWDVSYVKSMPRTFQGAAWNAWGFPGFTSKGIFSGAMYGFLDTIPTQGEIGSPALLQTKTLDVNQQMGISSPLFFDEGNPAPITKVQVDFSLTDAKFSGFITDNYLEITHLYQDRYGTLSFANGRETFPDDWWIYPYFQHDVDIDHEVFDIPADVYKYVYSPTGSSVDFNALTPDQYTTVIIPLYIIEGSEGLPLLNESGDPIIGSSAALTSEELITEDEWQRTTPESCQEPSGDCIADTRLVESELRDFGFATSWDVSCFSIGTVTVWNDDKKEADIAVSQMPVTAQWKTVPTDLHYKFAESNEKLVEGVASFEVLPRGNQPGYLAKVTMTGIPDTFKSSPSSPESGNSSTVELIVSTPVDFVVQSYPETRWKWASGSWLEINASFVSMGYEYVDGADAGIMYNPTYILHSNGIPQPRHIVSADPTEWVFFNYTAYNYIHPTEGEQLRAIYETTFTYPNNPGTNCNNYAPTWTSSHWRGLRQVQNWRHCYYLYPVGAWWAEPQVPVPRGWVRSRLVRPYILFSNGVKHYGQSSDYYGNSSYGITIESSTDTQVYLNGTVYYFANDIESSTKYQTTVRWILKEGGEGEETDFDYEYAYLASAEELTVFENEKQIYQKYFDERYPTQLTGKQLISEYKRSIHNASISFTRTFNGITEIWSWYAPGKGVITFDQVTGDCNEQGRFVYAKNSLKGKLGKTTITEQDSDREPDILYKFISYREADEVLDREVTPELSKTYVHAGGKIFSAVHTAGILSEIHKPYAKDSPNHQASEIKGTPKISINNSLSGRTIAAPKEDFSPPKWDLDRMPPTVDQKSYSSTVGGEEVSIGDTLRFVGTFQSEPEYVGGAVWEAEWRSLPIDYTGIIPELKGLQWSNHHEYFVPRKREYWGTDISGRADEGQWLNGWEPINTVGSTGYLPSGEFRSLGLYHDTTTAKLTYGIKGVLETVQGVKNEPLHFAFAYGAHYGVFGKVNNGLGDDDQAKILKSPASDDLAQLLTNKQLQTSATPPLPAIHDYDLLMRQAGYSWGGFKNLICPYNPGLAAEVNSINSQLPQWLFPFATVLSTQGIESNYKLGFRYVDPAEAYRITANGVTITKTASNRQQLINAFFAEVQAVLPPSSVIAQSEQGLTITTTGSVGAYPLGGLTGFELLTSTNDDTATTTTYTLAFPGVNGPYSLELDGNPLTVSVSNAATKNLALAQLAALLSAYEVTYEEDLLSVKGVYLIEKQDSPEFNDIYILPAVVATEATDKPWRTSEIKWDATPTCGKASTSNLELSSTTNISKRLKYKDLDFSAYPYARITQEKNPSLFVTHNAELLDEPQPGGLLDLDFTLVVEYSKDGAEWKELELATKQIKPSWFGAMREDVNIIALAPAVIKTDRAEELKDLILGEPN